MYTLLRLLFYTSGFSINLYRISTPVLPILLKWFAYINLHSGVEKNRTPVLLPYSRKRLALCSTQGGGASTTDTATASHWLAKYVRTNYSEIRLNLAQLSLEQLRYRCHHTLVAGQKVSVKALSTVSQTSRFLHDFLGRNAAEFQSTNSVV